MRYTNSSLRRTRSAPGLAAVVPHACSPTTTCSALTCATPKSTAHEVRKQRNSSCRAGKVSQLVSLLLAIPQNQSRLVSLIVSRIPLWSP